MDIKLVNKLKAILRYSDVFTDEATLHTYSYDSTCLEPVIPEVVVFPNSQEELGKVVRVLSQEGYAITVRGSGTNLSGGTIPAKQKGAVIVTTRLNKILEINLDDLYARVEPGVITFNLAKEVEKYGLFYPPDPGSQKVSTMGGNVAENAGGLRGLKYGVTGHYVMGLTFFDSFGELVKTGSKTVKCVSGYNLSSFMVGSEGTLGVISEITLKLIPKPSFAKSMLVIFDDIEKASFSVSDIIRHKIVPCTLEFLDNFTIRCVEQFRKTGLPIDAEAMLLIELDGHKSQVEEEFIQIEKILKKNGARLIKIAKNSLEKEAIWQARRDALPALARIRPSTILEDVTVPRSKIPEMIKAIQYIQQKYSLQLGIFGHVGDGNLHPTILTDIRDKEEFIKVEQAIDELFENCLTLEGTISGEHGIGIAKLKYMPKEFPKGTLVFSSRLKKAVDPKNILNPGKLVFRQF
ncbi:MAG: FAD-linked oxidase C-terminal domain-containing protein [Desulfonauticus sp.]|nr:FAD-linked oxidase C-terminal domain-containing protein [Desulfonauticus sp.]